MDKRAARGKLTSIKPGWVPVREAPFRFRAKRGPGGVFSEGTSLAELTATLIELSGANEARINVQTQTFEFGFVGRAGEYWGGAPWEILASAELRELTEPPLPDPDMLFDKRFKFIGDEEHRVERKRHRAIASATGVVWRQTMLFEFKNAIEAGQISVFARPNAQAPFQPVPPEVWPSYQINDWSTGYAIGPNSSTLLAIHVAPRPSSRRGRAPIYDPERIRGHVFRLLKSKGIPNLENDEGWRTPADLKRELEAFCERVFGKTPARSTLDRLVDGALSEWNFRKQAVPGKGE